MLEKEMQNKKTQKAKQFWN